VYDEPVAVVDGKCRARAAALVGRSVIGEEAWQVANSLLDAKVGRFQPGMMELGATVCLPRQPRCLLVSGVRSVRIARRIGNPASGATTAEARNPFRPARRNGEVFLVHGRMRNR